MQAACDLIWAKTTQMKLSLRSIVLVMLLNVKSFPYQFSDGTVAVFLAEANSLLTASKGEHVTMCLLCEAKVPDMRCHVGQHILRALCNTREVISMKEQVGEHHPCGFCGHSGWPECAIMITVTASSAPTWTTCCKYQHAFKYGACTLCYLVLPPEPGRSSQKAPVLAVDAIWCYNMLEHVMTVHDEYSVPGYRSEGVELPASTRNDIMLTDLEQSSVCIPKERWITPPNVSSGTDKENVPASSSHPVKRSMTTSTSYKPAKCTCTTRT
ncbi:uncharacterized protein EDB93DRAFT_1255517 [Suillus bovinus]|uniref:uncharacterized protein n=1 Tax=Suillus bovinus TaxID=48563 RepID=UPI001B87ACCC|nr:uncharacterized protein EDB93DRAFT_1255517 [Suillus bovinus]KAG2131406.1 hypothetical protein EDB93DRAFT_1255517 [Suillus bovinus]